MAIILNIETATALCSVALAVDGKVLARQEILEHKSHAAKLTVFIEEVLHETNLQVGQLHCISVGKGPGSYTGLRIGVAVAKGLCYGANLPLIAIGTLEILFKEAFNNQDRAVQEALKEESTLLCPMIDAKRMEVFNCLYTLSGIAIEETAARIIDQASYRSILAKHKVIFLGSGMEKCRTILDHPNALFAANVHPKAATLAVMAEKEFHQGHFEDPAYFEPFYLKDFIATTPKKGLMGKLL
jgi:tRNA threonylcarbamoyladenosine biosynthesis protein TsaB